MASYPKKPLNLVISAIRSIQEQRGSSSRQILNYISSVCNIPRNIAHRQVLTALKRGTMHGILQETDGRYSLPTDPSTQCFEVATQELGLLDLSCRKRKQHKRKHKDTDGCGRRMKKSRKKSRRRHSRRRKNSKTRKMRRSGSEHSAGRRRRNQRSRKTKRNRKNRKNRSKYDCRPVSRRSSRSKRSKRRSSKREKKREKERKDCTCPPKTDQNPHNKTEKSDKDKRKDANKCTMNFSQYMGKRADDIRIDSLSR